MSESTRRKASLLTVPALALLVAACSGGSGGVSPSPSGSPSDAPSPSADASQIEHPTGPTDIVLRYDEGGGFVMAGFAATMLPPFTLYGDGTIVFRDPTLEPPPMDGSIGIFNPMRTARLTEAQVQDLLQLALADSGLAAARPEYRYDMVADAGTAIFTVEAGGLSKTVSVYALGMEGPDVPDGPARAAFAKLAQTLTSIESGGVVQATDYVPASYRAVLFESPGVTAPDMQPWPWDDIAVADFKPDADPNGLQFPHRAMTAEELDALGVGGYEGGFQGAVVTGPDGITYTLSARPLLPGESS